MKGSFLTALAGLALFTTGGARSAWAAIAAPCAPATMAPAAPTLPANLPGFGYTALKATSAQVHLYTAAKTEVPLTVGPVEGGYLKVVPTSPLTVGASYELQFESFCGYGPYPPQGPIAFTVTPAAPLPTELGVASTAPTSTAKDLGTTQFTITASYTLHASMKPWVAAYRFGVAFDDRPIETKVTLSANGDVAQVTAKGWCDEASAAKPKHSVVLRARLPFATTLETAPSVVEFACPAPKFTTPPQTTPVIPSPSATASGAPSAPTTTTTTTDGGCSLAATGAVAPPFAALAPLALALGLALRRRNTAVVIANKGDS